MASMMTSGEVEVIINEAVEAAIKALRQERYISIGESPYKRTERILRNLEAFRGIEADKIAQIEQLQEYGLPKSSASVVVWQSNSGTKERGNDLVEDTVRDTVDRLWRSVERIRGHLREIDAALAHVKSDPYWYVIEEYYFKGFLLVDIAAEHSVSTDTVSRNKARLVRVIQHHIFPEDSLDEMMMQM